MDPVEVGTNTDTAREKVRSELDKVKDELDRITDPQAKESRRSELADQFWRVNNTKLNLQSDEDVVEGNEGLILEIRKKGGELPGDDKAEANRVANKMTQNIEAHVYFNDVRSEIGKVIFKAINERNRVPKTMVLLYPIVSKILSKGDDYLTFSPNEGEPISEFEKDLRIAVGYDKAAFDVLLGALRQAVQDPQRGERNRAQLGLQAGQDVEAYIMYVTNQERERLKNESQKAQDKLMRGGEQELHALLEYFSITNQEEEMRLARTFYSEEAFIDYVREMFWGGEHERNRENLGGDKRGGVIEKAYDEMRAVNPSLAAYEDLPMDQRLAQLSPDVRAEVNTLANKYFSDEFNERMRRFIGELHRSVDEKDYRSTWQESAQKGNPFYNLNSLMSSLDNRINRLKHIDIRNFGVEGLDFYVKDQKEKTIVIENVSKFNVETDKIVTAVRDGKAVKLIERKLIVPVNEWRKVEKSSDTQVNWGEYIQTVQNSIKTEIGVRKFLHDARALPFLTVGHDESYLQMLQKFASSETDSTLFDSVHTMYDSEDIDATSNLSAKMRELAFAREDWIFKSLLVDYNLNTGRTRIDDDTFKQLEVILRNKSLSERNRVFSAGIGANFGLDLSALTGPSQADPSMKENGTPNFGSFGERDTALYGGFNIMTMGHHRWGSEASTLWGLLYVPLESAHLKEYFNDWDFNKLLREQAKFVNSFVAGKDQKDIEEGTIRLVDLFNIGKGGSVYDRGGWRMMMGYEGWLVQEDPGKMDIMKSWKAIENIGIEALKDFVGNIDTYNSGFNKLDPAKADGSTDAKRQAQVAKRRELFEYVYRKYFVAPELGLSEQQIQEEMEKLFTNLETEKADLSHHGSHDAAPIKSRSSNYKTFFYQALTRAMVQRMPTKFIRTELERTRKVSSLRARAWDEVLDESKNGADVTLDGVTYHHNIGNDESLSIKDKWEGVNKESETYFVALQDIIAGEVLLRKTASAQMRKEVDKMQGFMHEVDLGDSYNLTAERLAELWEKNGIKLDENPDRDRARKLNALTVLKSTRKYLFTKRVIVNSESGKEDKYLDDFAKKFEGGLPHGPGFALATEELAREFIVHRAAGENMPRRAFGDNVRLEAGVVKEIDAFFGSLYETGISHSHSFDKLVKHIKTVRDTLDGVHGQELAHRVSLWMATTAISLYKLNSKDEWLLGGALTPYHSSLMSYIAGGHTEHIWEWDRVTIREFMEALILNRVLPREPYSAQNAPSYEPLYKVDHNGEIVRDKLGNPEIALDKNGKPLKRRKQDFHKYAEQLAENFLQNPLREVAIRLAVIAPVGLIAMIVSMIIQAYKKVNNVK